MQGTVFSARVSIVVNTFLDIAMLSGVMEKSFSIIMLC